MEGDDHKDRDRSQALNILPPAGVVPKRRSRRFGGCA
jgi:hypothetical protein